MNVERAVVEFGTEAVHRYRAMAETRHDNELPDGFLRSHVASRLHERFQCPVHVDRLYATLAIDLGVPVTPDLISFLGGQRAHVAMYADGRPSAIIELKVFDEATPLPAVGSGLDKARMLQRLGTLEIFVGVMICPITLSLEARIERLHDALGGNMYVGERQASRDRQWEWCFACAAIRPA
jgi:hypothetical protein